jgi:hypothetical protein
VTVTLARPVTAEDAEEVGDRHGVVAEQDAGREGAGHCDAEPRHEATSVPGGGAARAAYDVGGVVGRQTRGRGAVEDEAHNALPVRRIRAMKTGTPTAAAMIPTCTSEGGRTTRPTVSATTTSTAPSRI